MTQEEYDRVSSSAIEWMDKKDAYYNSRLIIFGKRPKFWLLVFGILLIFAILILDESETKEVKPKSKAIVMATVLFEKPDNASTVLVKDILMNDVIVKDTTKYYYHVELLKQGKSYFGYISKESVFESKHSSRFVISIEILFSVFVGIITWILSKYFVSYSDRKIGQAQLLFRKLGWCLSAMVITLFFSYKLSFLFFFL